jgi:hypothetical protein
LLILLLDLKSGNPEVSVGWDERVNCATHCDIRRKIYVSALLSLLVLLRSKTFCEQGIDVACAVPEVEMIKLLFGIDLPLCLDLQFETCCQVGFGRDMCEKVRDVRKFGILGAQCALQIDAGFGLRHDEIAYSIHR